MTRPKQPAHKSSESRRQTLPDEYVYFVCERFFNGESVSKIAEWLESEGFRRTREAIYPIIRRGRTLGFLDLQAPPTHQLEDEIRRQFDWAPSHTRVLNVELQYAQEQLTQAAAKHVLRTVKEFKQRPKETRKDVVHIGLGAGGTTERFARNFSLLLRRESRETLPNLQFHAISSGFLPTRPASAPVSFFSYFMDLDLDISYVGLFSEPAIDVSQFEALKKSPGVDEAFELAKNIDIVVTSLSAADDPHSLFVEFMKKAHREQIDALLEQDLVGDVQWQPYTSEAPIPWTTGQRPVTLFEIEDFVRMSWERDKHVVLICGPCPRSACLKQNRTKARALRPLLEKEELRVCNHLFTDKTTATHLLNPPAGDSPPDAADDAPPRTSD